uniref:Ectodysplasin A2 receptor n=1 Tax=Electrophorus electricus TaxID=8005 RepID=A0A4W4EGN0_ELEEL
MDCAEDEFSLNGECHKCLQCPPGQELKEDCGYGLGVSATCGVCELHWFKAAWGSHLCRMCQNCRRLNRQKVMSCTQTHNAVCGDCLPGFYSKRRLDGLQDLECLPCGPAHFRSVQCSKEDMIEQVWSSEAPPPSSTVMMTTCVAAVTMVIFLFAIVVLMYQGFGSLKKLLRELCQSSPYSCLVSMPTTSNPSLHVCESPPPLHSSICSNLISGVITQATGSLCLPPASDNPLPLALTEALSIRGRHCAGVQEEGWGRHGPVECTELDCLNLAAGQKMALCLYKVNYQLILM